MLREKSELYMDDCLLLIGNSLLYMGFKVDQSAYLHFGDKVSLRRNNSLVLGK